MAIIQMRRSFITYAISYSTTYELKCLEGFPFAPGSDLKKKNKQKKTKKTKKNKKNKQKKQKKQQQQKTTTTKKKKTTTKNVNIREQVF